MLYFDGLDDRLGLVLRGLDVDTIAQPREKRDRSGTAGRVRTICRIKQRPELKWFCLIEQANVEVSRHHADDFVRHAIENDGRTNDRRTGAKLLLPESVAHDDSRGPDIRRVKRPSKLRVHAKRSKELWCDGHADTFGAPARICHEM